MYDDMYLYRLLGGELIVAHQKDRDDNKIILEGPHSIIEQEGKVMLQPSIPQTEGETVELATAHVLMATKAPKNIVDGYRQALSGIVTPNQATADNVTPLSAGLKKQ
jgi:hypothetical protein